jgi:hypothetical protein
VLAVLVTVLVVGGNKGSSSGNTSPAAGLTMPPPPPGMVQKPPAPAVNPPPTAVASPAPAVAPPSAPVARAESPTPGKHSEGSRTTEPGRHVADGTTHESTKPPKEHVEDLPKAHKGADVPDDDEFASVFGPAKKPKHPRDADDDSTPSRKSGKDVYIPAAPGSGGDVPETLGQADIMQTVVSHKPEIVDCVKKQKQKDPDNGGGTLAMRWTIQPDGRTGNIVVTSDDLKGSYIASCITGLIKGWRFPKHKQAQEIPFPFKF